MKKKVLLIGPINDNWGRDIEVNMIAKSLENNFSISVFSTSYMTEKSVAIQKLRKVDWNTTSKKVYEKNLVIKILSKISKWHNKGKSKTYFYLNNSWVKRLYDLENIYIKSIKTEIDKSTVVFACVQLSSKFLPEIIEYCFLSKTPLIVRTTGNIKRINENTFDLLKKVDLFIHHSVKNSNNISNQIKLPFILIDQSAYLENKLLKLPIKFSNNLKFGFIGGIEKEKGVFVILEYFLQSNSELIIAGDGTKRIELLSKIENKNNITYLGSIKANKVDDFYNSIDVLIIPSYEESGPFIGIEAMAASKIIISTRVGAMEERLLGTKNSFWFDVDDDISLEKTIESVLSYNKKELESIAQSLKDKYLRSYSTEIIQAKYIDAVNSLTNSI